MTAANATRLNDDKDVIKVTRTRRDIAYAYVTDVIYNMINKLGCKLMSLSLYYS